MDVNVAMQLSEDAARQLTQEAELFAKLCPPELRVARVQSAMEQGGFLSGGRFEFAPAQDKDAARQRYQQRDDEVLARSLADIADGVRLLTELMPAVENELMEPPTAGTIIAEMRKNSLAPEGPLVAELLEATLERDVPARVATMTVSEAAAAYERALEAPRKPTSAATIRAIELQLRGDGFRADPHDEQAVDRLAGLSKLVKQTREGRLPERVKAVRAAVEKGQRAVLLARAGNIRPGASVEQQHLRQLQQMVKG